MAADEQPDLPDTDESSPSQDEGEELEGPLPREVRRRVLDLVSGVLDAVPERELPPNLVKVSKFTPRKRATLGGEQIAAALEVEGFRDEVLTHLDPGATQTVEAIVAGHPPAAADPVQVAALAFLSRRRGWTSLVRAATQQQVAALEEGRTNRLERDNDRLKRQVSKLKDRIEQEQTRSQQRIEELRRDAATEAQSRREAEKALAEEVARREAAERRAVGSSRPGSPKENPETQAALAEAQAEVTRLQDALAQHRAASKMDQNLVEARVRLLLDTLVDASSGLRREMGIAADAGHPADLVLAQTEPGGSRLPSGAVATADELAEVLRLPRAHLIVDGYNVTKQDWGGMSLQEQRTRLLQQLGPVAAQTGAEVTVVFDGQSGVLGAAPRAPRGVRVVFSQDETADDLIRTLVAAEPSGRVVVIASTDKEVAAAARRPGHRSVASALLLRVLGP